MNCGASSTHNHHVAYVGIVLLAHNLTYVLDVLLGCHEVSNITVQQHIVTAGDDGVVSTFHSHHMVGSVLVTEVAKLDVDDMGCLAQLDAQHHKGATLNLPVLSDP